MKASESPAAAVATSKTLNIPYVNQLPTYPTGCEAASSTMLLKYHGYHVSISSMIDAIPREDMYFEDGKLYGPDPNKVFVGDPRGNYNGNPTYGFVVWAPPVASSLQQVIDANGGRHTVKNMTGCSFDDLLNAIDNNQPVIVWATYKMQASTATLKWYIKEDGTERCFNYPNKTHVMVLSGYDKDNVVVVDPYGLGTVKFSRSAFQERWKSQGYQAVTMIPR